MMVSGVFIAIQSIFYAIKKRPADKKVRECIKRTSKDTSCDIGIYFVQE